MTQLFFSIIIPVYNTADYIGDCIDSILNQNFDRSLYEVILIDDGSTDSSWEVITLHSKKITNVKLVRKENEGVSVARNVGLQAAEAKNIMFLDSDDYLEKNIFKKLYTSLKLHDIEVLIGRSFAVNNGQRNERYYFSTKNVGSIFTGVDLVIRNSYFRGSVCGVVFNKEFLETHELKFIKDLKNGEDTLFMIMCFLHAKKIKYIDTTVYLINQRQGSASRFWDFERVFKMGNNIKALKNATMMGYWSADQLSILEFGKYLVVSNMLNALCQCFSVQGYFKIRGNLIHMDLMEIKSGKIKLCKSKIRIYNTSIDLFFVLVFLKQFFSKTKT